MEYLSNIELYYTQNEPVNEIIRISGDEYEHIVKVMRRSPSESIYVTDGKGKIYEAVIRKIDKNSLEAKICRIFSYINKKKNLIFCLPGLKNPERFEFALEKSAELGITNFLVFNSERTITKRRKLERWNKILISAMKQSLLSFLPSITEAGSIQNIINMEGEKIIFDQSGAKYFSKKFLNMNKKYLFIFGPEGGLTGEELKLINENNIFRLAENRLRAETAVVKFASML